MEKLHLKSIPEIQKLIRNKNNHIKRLETELKALIEKSGNNPDLYHETQIALTKVHIANLKAEITICEKEISDREITLLQKQ